MKKSHISIAIFGGLLALLAVLLQFFEYRYFVGTLSSDIYTGIVATIFTIVGVWIGYNFINRKKIEVAPQNTINHEKIKALKLNDREYEVLALISKGHTNQEIANELFLALPTIKTHTSNLYSKLDVKNRTQAVHKARTLNLL